MSDKEAADVIQRQQAELTKLRERHILFADLLEQARNQIYGFLEEVRGQPQHDTFIKEIDEALAKYKKDK